MPLAACSEAPAPEQTVTPTTTAEVQQLSESQKLNAWFEEKYEQQLQFSPLGMTRLGRKDAYDQIDDMSEQAEERQFAWQTVTVEELKSKFDYNKLDDDTKISYDLWVYQYEQAKSLRPFTRRNYVLTQMMGMQSMLPTLLINYHKVAEVSDMQAYISRLQATGRAIEQLTTRVAINADEGVKVPYFAYEGVIAQSKGVISGQPFDPDSETDASLFADAKGKINALLEAGTIDQAEADKLTEDAKQALLASVLPAYQQLINWFENDLPNVSSKAQGVSALPDGSAFYNAMLALRTTTALTADEIHQIGLNEVARLLKEMTAIKEQEGFDGDLQAFFSYIKSDTSDQRFYFPNTDEGRQSYLDDSSAYLDNIKAKLPEFFGILPKADLVVKRVESYREQPGAPQHYFLGLLMAVHLACITLIYSTCLQCQKMKWKRLPTTRVYLATICRFLSLKSCKAFPNSAPHHFLIVMLKAGHCIQKPRLKKWAGITVCVCKVTVKPIPCQNNALDTFRASKRSPL